MGPGLAPADGVSCLQGQLCGFREIRHHRAARFSSWPMGPVLGTCFPRLLSVIWFLNGGRVVAGAWLQGRALSGATDPQTSSPGDTRRCLLALLRCGLTPQHRGASSHLAFQAARLKDGNHVKRHTAAPGAWAWVLSTSPAPWDCATLLGLPGRPRDTLPPLFQGRAGSDGARGMPGQTGPKVGHARHLLGSSQPWPPSPASCW